VIVRKIEKSVWQSPDQKNKKNRKECLAIARPEKQKKKINL